MKNFDHKWQDCVTRAQDAPSPRIAMPSGFVERVLDRSAAPETVALSAERVWLQLGLRTLAALSVVLVVFVSIQRASLSKGTILRPPIEHSIVDFSGLL